MILKKRLPPTVSRIHKFTENYRFSHIYQFSAMYSHEVTAYSGIFLLFDKHFYIAGKYFIKPDYHKHTLIAYIYEKNVLPAKLMLSRA